MATIYVLNCPRCTREFYITPEFAGQGYDWCCPFCEHTFKEEQSLPAPGRSRPGQASASGPHQGHKM